MLIKYVNFEKFALGVAFLGTLTVGLVKYCFGTDISDNFLWLVIGCGTLFTGRKVASYFKKDNYINKYEKCDKTTENYTNNVEENSGI